MKAIILCADDYALNAAVDEGIVQLVKMGRLSAVGCMTESPRWLERDNPLPNLRDRIDIGLHFNLTQPFPPQPHITHQRHGNDDKQPLPQILRKALIGTISIRAVVDTLHTQLDHFESVMGDAPDFVDGHQHVHIFPHIRKSVLDALAQRYRMRRPWLRQVNPNIGSGADWPKRLLLAALNQRFEQAAQHKGFACNRYFAGIYSLQPDADFPQRMRDWLARSSSGTLLMCHPGRENTNPKEAAADDIAAARARELAWLASAEFAELLAQQHIRLVRFGDL